MIHPTALDVLAQRRSSDFTRQDHDPQAGIELIILLLFEPLNLLIYASGWTAQIYRLMAEERLLSRDETYRAYVQRVRWRLIPGLF